MGGFGGPMMGPGAGGPRPKKRPVQVMLILSLCGIIGNVLSQVGANAGIGALAGLGSLISLGGLVGGIFTILQLIDLKNYTNDPEFNWWFIFIPCVNLWFLWSKVPMQVAKARQMAGVNPVTKPAFQYFFLAAWALASDLEEISQ
jgi:hypothetical protein